jgi:threonine dehydrogenase-like Zn-dependent dehydrogenase
MKALWHGRGDVRVDPFFVIHRVGRDDGREADHTFRDKQAGSVKVVMTP